MQIPVYTLVDFLASECYPARIRYYHVVTTISRWVVNWLVLPHQNLGNFRSQSAKNLTLCINSMP